MFNVRTPKPWTAKSLADHHQRSLGLAAAGFIRRTPAYAIMRQRQAAGGHPEVRIIGANARMHVFVEMGKGWP